MIMFTVDGQRNVVTDTGSSASFRVYDLLTYGRVGRSDHQPFHYGGIPVVVFTYAHWRLDTTSQQTPSIKSAKKRWKT